MNDVTDNRSKQPDQKFCHECGAAIRQQAEICPECGVRQMGFSHEAPNGKSRIAAALLAIFLGNFGIHRFYLGQVGLGFLYLVFCWTFIPAIVAFIDFILLLVMSDMQFARKYGHR